MNNATDILTRQQSLSSGVVERWNATSGEYEQIAGFTGLVLSSEPFVKEGTPTDDGIAALKTVRQDGRATFNLRMLKSQYLIEKLFSLPATVVVGVAVPITDEVSKVDLKAGDGIYEALLRYPSGNGAKNTTVVVKDSTGVITYILDTDYTIEVVNGLTAVRMISGGDITQNQSLLISYEYLPLTSAKLTPGVAKVLESQQFRFREAPDAAGSSITDNLISFTFPCADVVSGLNFGFVAESGESEEFEMEISIENRKGEIFEVDFTPRT